MNPEHLLSPGLLQNWIKNNSPASVSETVIEEEFLEVQASSLFSKIKPLEHMSLDDFAWLADSPDRAEAYKQFLKTKQISYPEFNETVIIRVMQALSIPSTQEPALIVLRRLINNIPYLRLELVSRDTLQKLVTELQLLLKEQKISGAHVMRILLLVIEKVSNRRSNMFITAFFEHIDTITNNQFFTVTECIRFIKPVLNRTDLSPEQIEQLKVFLAPQIKTELASLDAEAVAYLFSISQFELAQEIVSDYLFSTYGIKSGKALVDAWYESFNDRNSYLDEELISIRLLESVKPGSADFLSDTLGIRNFARYSGKLLLRQYEGVSMKDRPLAVIVAARFDHNNASYVKKSLYDDLSNQLSDEYNVLVIEVETVNELARKLLFLEKQTGRKISFAYFDAHADKDVMQVGRYHGGDLLSTDLKRKSFEKAIQRLFLPEATVVLGGCFTGVEGGIAQKLSESGLDVIAPDQSTKTLKVTVTIKKSQEKQFSALYSSGAQPKRYKFGEYEGLAEVPFLQKLKYFFQG